MEQLLDLVTGVRGHQAELVKQQLCLRRPMAVLCPRVRRPFRALPEEAQVLASVAYSSVTDARAPAAVAAKKQQQAVKNAGIDNLWLVGVKSLRAFGCVL